ncbi:MAG: bifunctional 4-hydroxy-2-oxoglutarate aldolase/2-dehydro-3-deoxy-phosphogluconate aldolase [Verrucomicrobia bacterium]|nr:bifunctional 4-hydroxy-2-oxoglutarate aldolase/2-dehydro-3-deoxy-phosphogluconate aldolase [Verrucomicrobiota bacterium]MBV9671881.1 bifunctional 4-hydroxy-2-oxoglutarate aldolase/2-dehydro-3-deoxy-phosphogluconate aldolase [Verrucomicrobiota bacterium]
MTEILKRLEQLALVPIIAIENLDQALYLADALLHGGLPVAEITFRTMAAAEVIALLHEQRPELLLGAGTVLNSAYLAQARAAGAAFALAPGLDLTVIGEAGQLGFPFYPGVMTPTDIQAGLKAGVSVFKFFPAVPAGGLELMRAILAPFAHLAVRVIPTGGVKPQDVREWLCEPSVLAVGGTWIASRQAIAARDWQGIQERAKAAVSIASEARMRKDETR